LAAGNTTTHPHFNLLRENNAEKGGGVRFFLSAALKAAPRGRAVANVLHFK
jgi:hypothetical protein